MFGDDALFVIVAFGIAFWAVSTFIKGNASTLGLIVLALLGAFFLTDFAAILANDLTGALVIAALLVFVASYVLRTTYTESVAILALGWVVGAALLNYTF